MVCGGLWWSVVICGGLWWSVVFRLTLSKLHLSCRTYTQSNQSLSSSLAYSLSVKLLSEHHLEFLSLKGGCTGSSESLLVKIPHCWK